MSRLVAHARFERIEPVCTRVSGRWVRNIHAGVRLSLARDMTLPGGVWHTRVLGSSCDRRRHCLPKNVIVLVVFVVIVVAAVFYMLLLSLLCMLLLCMLLMSLLCMLLLSLLCSVVVVVFNRVFILGVFIRGLQSVADRRNKNARRVRPRGQGDVERFSNRRWITGRNGQIVLLVGPIKDGLIGTGTARSPDQLFNVGKVGILFLIVDRLGFCYIA